jgi:hypothetical protein
LSCFLFAGKIKSVVNEKAGTRNFREQIANRLIYSQRSKEMARIEQQSSNHDYNSFIRSLLNENHSFEDGSYSPKDSLLSAFETNLILGFLDLTTLSKLENYKIFGRCRYSLLF